MSKVEQGIIKQRAEDRDLVSISVITRVPCKWRFVDLETGDVWEWRDGHRRVGRVESYDDETIIIRGLGANDAMVR
jgi:hypothetical protein